MIKIRYIPEFALIALLSASIFYNIKLLQELKPVEGSVSETQTAANVTNTAAEPDVDVDVSEKVNLRTLDEVNAEFSKLGVNSNARTLALTISEIDSWLIEPETFDSVKVAVDKQVVLLRKKILDEVSVATKNALTAKNGKLANRFLEEVGFLVSLYPMGDSESIINQAKDLTESHRNLAFKLEGLRRVRYNHWAVIRIEQALTEYHKNSKFWSPKKENAVLVSSLVTYLGEVDPNLLEPTVLSLYNYVVDITKDSISEADKVNLAKRITSPNIQRVMLDKF